MSKLMTFGSHTDVCVCVCVYVCVCVRWSVSVSVSVSVYAWACLDFVRGDDVEVMLHNLGAFLSAKQVEGLVNWSSSSRRINYRKWSISHKPVFDGKFYTHA